jgi:hypothetical protein
LVPRSSQAEKPNVRADAIRIPSQQSEVIRFKELVCWKSGLADRQFLPLAFGNDCRTQ